MRVSVVSVCLLGVALLLTLAITPITVEATHDHPAFDTNAFRHLVGKSPAKDCAVCTLVLGLLEQYALDKNLPLAQAANNWCAAITTDLPLLTPICDVLLSPLISKVQNDFNNRVSPDVTCKTTLTSCAEYPTCSLFGKQWPPAPHTQVPRVGVKRSGVSAHKYAQQVLHRLIPEFWKAELIEEKVKNKQHLLNVGKPKDGHWLPIPIPDFDKDGYAANWTYRGSQYRGKDCNEKDPNVYPGKDISKTMDVQQDANCNGIWGVDGNGVPYEQSLCTVESRGTLSIGDSATAHFAIPPPYLWPSKITNATYADLVKNALSELDWPQCSWSTGHLDSSECPPSILNVTSFYMKMNERNRCTHRDFVNMGVNGESVRSIGPPGNIQAIPARFKKDGPATVFFAMIGNDICGAKQLGKWTPIQQFHDDAVNAFKFLDSNLYPGSHVIASGLVDGRILYDTLHDRIHPLGMTYSTFYDYLNCLDISPCWSWMNTNQTVRDLSTQHAQQLSAQYATIINQTQFQNFDLSYFTPDFGAIIKAWVNAGHDAADLIEPVDGFHPSQTGNILLANLLWTHLEKELPDALGPINPNNDKIQQLFGDQGGY